MKKFAELVSGRKEWLISRLFFYIKEKGYLKFTSVLLAAWKISTDELHDAFLTTLQSGRPIPELQPDEETGKDPITLLGYKEARRYQPRGVQISILLGLLKYYRQSFFDLIDEAGFEPAYREKCCCNVERFFDRLEIGFCAGWTETAHSGADAPPAETEPAATASGGEDGTPDEPAGVPPGITGSDGEREILRIIRLLAHEGIIVAVADGTITGWNAAAERLLGWTEEEAVGKDIRSLDPDGTSPLAELYGRCLQGEKVSNSEIVLRRKNGETVTVLCKAAPICDESGAAESVVALLTDITPVKEMEKEMAESREKLFDSFDDPDGPGKLRKIVIELK